MAQTLNPDPTPDTGAQLPGPTPLEWYQASRLKGGRDTGGFRPGGSSFSTFKGAGIKGADHNDAAMNAAAEWHKMPHAAQLDYMTKQGAPPALIDMHKAAAPATPALPPSVLAMPNQPDVNGGRPGNNVMQRFAAMGVADAARNTAVKQAVTAAHAAQVANPEGTINAAVAVRDAALAKDGVTDLGGGAKAMQNKYGSGFAVPMPEGPRQPGVIRDEKGTVDVGEMMANKGSNGPVPYVAPTPQTPFANSPTAGETRQDTQQQIATGIASIMPGADKRRQKDAEREVEVFRDNTAFQYGSGIFDRVNNYVNSGGFTSGDGKPPAAIAKAPQQPAKPEVIQAGRLRVPTLAEAMNPPKQTGPLPHVPQDFKPVKDIPAAKTVAGYNVAPSFTAEEAEQADAKNAQDSKALDEARTVQWDNHLNEIRRYAADNGIPLSELTQKRYPSPIDGQDADLRPTPGLARILEHFRSKGIGITKQHGTGRAVPWDELIQDVYQRATPNAPKSQHPSLGQLFQSAFDQVTSRKS